MQAETRRKTMIEFKYTEYRVGAVTEKASEVRGSVDGPAMIK
jgi:hypothetical protein